MRHVHLKKRATETTDAEFAAVLQTHVFGALCPRARGGPPHVGTALGLRPASLHPWLPSSRIPQVTAYSAAKSAYLGIVRTLATEWWPAWRARQRHRTRLDCFGDAGRGAQRRRRTVCENSCAHSVRPFPANPTTSAGRRCTPASPAAKIRERRGASRGRRSCREFLRISLSQQAGPGDPPGCDRSMSTCSKRGEEQVS